MTIIGNTRPLTNTAYTYTISGIKGIVKPKEWRIVYNGKHIGKSTNGIFKFHTNLAGKTVKIIAVLLQNGKEVLHSINVIVLLGYPKILKVEWQDSQGVAVGDRKVAYLDKIRLCLKTNNIPKGDPLKISVFEDDTTGDRLMGTYNTSGVNDNGYAYLYFNQLSLYQTKLNNADWVNESEHEYYVRIEYKNHISRTEEKIQLIVQNKLRKDIDQPKSTNKPVVVAAPTSKDTKNQKEKFNVTFNMFFDGTMNNRINTGERIAGSGIYHAKSNKKDDSYTNFYSNVALLYMTNVVKPNEDVIKIYTEGIGTADKKTDQAFPGGALGTGIAVYMRGVKDKVARGLSQMKEFANDKYFSKGKLIGKVTINVFGFSRGAAAARYFLSQEHIMIIYLKLKSKNDITFNFVGLFDTVASYGIVHSNDVTDLQLALKGKPKKVVQLAAADEYRSNFILTDITSSIKAGVGYQLTMPGVHSDIGGGYSEKTDEKRFLGDYMEYGESNHKAYKKFDEIKKKYMQQGWYTNREFIIEEERKSNFSKTGTHSFSTLYKLYGFRKGIKNTYQFIPLSIMLRLSEKYSDINYNKYNIDTTGKKYNVTSELNHIKSKLSAYALGNDGINALAVSLPYEDLIFVRNKYLHRSNKDDEPITMGGRYDNKGNPDRDILPG